MSRALLRVACSSLLLVGGFALYLLVVYRLKRPPDPRAAQELRVALQVYGRLLAIRGLLPQLWIALPLAALLRRFSRDGGRAALVVSLAFAAGVAGLIVAAILLPANLPGAPRVVFTGPGNFAATWLEMSAAVLVAALLPFWLWPDPRGSTRPARERGTAV
ncbi:MAG TPA: hypothetical protein VMW19_01790 [Myxococcota bacterium]|nr:hypothetical protein [Myxococcota bacterium]